MLSDDVVITGKRAMARSYAKINLTLDVLGRRENGYHDVEMIMHTLPLFDLLVIDKSYGGISIRTNLHYLPENDKNIAYKAAEAFFNYTKIRSSVRIMIHKNIPVAAGLAGGSGNAAAVLCALDRLYGTDMGAETLCSIGASLGADVPFCIMGGTMLASGIGEKLVPVKNGISGAYLLLVKPPVNISTAAVYEAIDSARIIKRPDNKAVSDALAAGDIRAVCGGLCNVMESVTEKQCPVIGDIKSQLRICGARGALMSGSGPTVFGIFDDYVKAKRAHDRFSRQYRDVFLTNM